MAKYKSNGYGNQISFRYGIESKLSVYKRFEIGLGIEKYSRIECYNCVYFPSPNITPQSSYSPLINNSEFDCQYETDTKIKFLEIPISLSYDMLRMNKLSIFTEIGYSYQFVLGRKTFLKQLQSEETSIDESNEFYLCPKNRQGFH